VNVPTCKHGIPLDVYEHDGECLECTIESLRAKNARLWDALVEIELAVEIGQAGIVNSTELLRIAREALEVGK